MPTKWAIRTWACCYKCDDPVHWGPEKDNGERGDHIYHSDPAWAWKRANAGCVIRLRDAVKFDSYAEAQEFLWQIDGWWGEYEPGDEHTGPFYWIEEVEETR
jgi:hypothetical protein